MIIMAIGALLICTMTVSCYRKKKVRDRQMRFHAAHPFDIFGNSAYPIDSPTRCQQETDSIMYEQTEGLYETILDDESPYSELPTQRHPLPDHTIPPNELPTAEPQTTANSNAQDLFPVDRSRRCPSPVDYPEMECDTTTDNETYATVREMGQKPYHLEPTDEYVPMFDADDSEKVTYQNLTCRPAEKETDYQVPQPQNFMSGNTEKMEQSDYINCDGVEAAAIHGTMEDDEGNAKD